jgi:hypothetical protein
MTHRRLLVAICLSGSALAAVFLSFVGNAGCGGSECEGACECSGSDCVCPESGDCFIDCVDDCDLQCAGSGDCDFVCDDFCTATCSSSGECIVSMGDDSTASCTGSGDCDIHCNGDCAVACPGSGVCTVWCEPGFDCTLDPCSSNLQTCPDDVLVCGGSCP